MTLGQNLQAARKAKGLSQETLAEQIGVSRQALGKWEKDTALPGLDNLQAAAQVLGVSVDTLLGTEAAGPAPATMAMRTTGCSRWTRCGTCWPPAMPSSASTAACGACWGPLRLLWWYCCWWCKTLRISAKCKA